MFTRYRLTYLHIDMGWVQPVCLGKISLCERVQGIILLSLNFQGLQCGQYFVFVLSFTIVTSNVVENQESGFDRGLKM